jgi:hypothetical protein
MKTSINNDLIRSFGACYDPSEVGIPEIETLLIKDWVNKYRDVVKNEEDVIWLLCRKEFMSDKDIRLFAVWCARESFKLQELVDERSINACNVAERFANGEATKDEMYAAQSAAWSVQSTAWSAAWYAAQSAAWSAAWSAAQSTAWSAARSAAQSAAWSAARSAARSAQIDQLLTYF